MLTPREEIKLAEIERHLATEDPGLAARLGQNRPPRGIQRLAVGAAAAATALVSIILLDVPALVVLWLFIGALCLLRWRRRP